MRSKTRNPTANSGIVSAVTPLALQRDLGGERLA